MAVMSIISNTNKEYYTDSSIYEFILLTSVFLGAAGNEVYR